MDISLSQYINRSNDIVASSDPLHRTSNENELKHMISILQNTLKKVKENYEKFIILAASPVLADDPKPIVSFIRNVKLISDYTLVPNNINLCYTPELNKYSLKINNMTISGNLGNVYNNKILKRGRVQTHQVSICEYRNNCNNILSKQYCKFYHDPADLIVLRNSKIISEAFYKETIKYTRNFSNTSWLYIDNDNPNQNKNMRCIGSKNTITNDILLCKVSNFKLQIENMKMQVMHDILVLLMLNEHNLA